MSVTDIGEAKNIRVGKANRALALLRSMSIERSGSGKLVFVDPTTGEVLAIESKDFVARLRGAYLREHGDTASESAIRDAIAAFEGDDVRKSDREDPSQKKERDPSQSDLLVAIAKSKAELFCDEQGAAYAAVDVNGHAETFKVRSNAFRGWLDREYHRDHNRVSGGQAKADALGVIEGIAVHDGPMQQVYLRTAEHEGAIYLDIANAEREIVEVTAAGWKVITACPVRFRRPKGMLPLPCPVVGGSVDLLRDFVNVESDGQFKLLVAWIVAALRPRGPYPILDFQAEHGTGKSTASRLVRGLIDPNVSPIRSAPRELRDLAVSSRASHVIAYDNLSGIQEWLSDAMCRVATGGGFATRAMYSDDEEVIFDAVRPIIINGIDDIATRPDLADRCLVVKLPTIPKEKRQREKKLLRAFDKVAGLIFGALLSGLVGAIGREEEIELPELPRMADFAVWATAAERALGWEDGDFMAAYNANRKDAVKMALDADPVAVAVRALLDLPRFPGKFEGGATKLLEELKNLVTEEIWRSHGWPKAANTLSNRLRRAAPFLRAEGIEIIDNENVRPRTVTLIRTPPKKTDGIDGTGDIGENKDDVTVDPSVGPQEAAPRDRALRRASDVLADIVAGRQRLSVAPNALKVDDRREGRDDTAAENRSSVDAVASDDDCGLSSTEKGHCFSDMIGGGE